MQTQIGNALYSFTIASPAPAASFKSMETSFHIRARQLAQSIINTRTHLIRETGQCSETMRHTLDHISQSMNTRAFDADEKMSQFIYNHACELAYLIPGRNSASYTPMMGKLKSIIEEANTILSQQHETVH